MKYIFQKRNIIQFLIFIVYHNYLIKCDDPNCGDFKDCFNCTLCGDHNNKYCYCKWDSKRDENKCFEEENRYLSEWYTELAVCKDTIEQEVYCPTDTVYSKDDLDSDYSINFQISSDSLGNYGRKMLFCNFDYMDETSSDYILNIQFSSKIKKKPIVAYGCSFLGSQDKIQKIDEDKEISCSGSSNIYFYTLLQEEYSTSPVMFKITLNSSRIYKYITVFSIVIIVLLIATCVICCVSRFYNNKARRQLRLLMNQRARENMLRIQQENNYINNYNENNENIEEINRAKLDELFSKKMAEHYYKSEYNQYGGGCSICLDNFKKKSKVSMTPCKHVFHYKCIKDWLYKNAKNPKCPNCNKEVLVEDDIINDTKGGDETKIIKVKKKQNNNNNNNNNNNVININSNSNNILNNNLNFAARNSINFRTVNHAGGRGDVSQSQRQHLENINF